MSDGNILVDDSSAIENGGKNEESEHLYPEETEDSGRKGLSESSPEISTCDSDSSYPRFDLIFFSHNDMARCIMVDVVSFMFFFKD